MKISRLLEIVYILLDKKTVTAKELAEHFEVSTRTIYRDVDTLSEAGIPIYTNKGTGGGISLLDNFVLNKSLLSEKEQNEILSSLQGFTALNVEDAAPVLGKLAVIFNKNNINWIEVDFSHWGSYEEEKNKFNLLKEAILNKKTINFDYFSSYGKTSRRDVEPLKLIFKGQGWYVYGYCLLKSDFRIFRLSRIKNLEVTEKFFTRNEEKSISEILKEPEEKKVKIILHIDSKLSYRVYDEFSYGIITENSDGSFLVEVNLPETQWLYGYLMSFGDSVEVLEPESIKTVIKEILEKMLENYSK